MKLLLAIIFTIFTCLLPSAFAQGTGTAGGAQPDSSLVINQDDYKVDTIGQTIMRQIVEKVSNGLEDLKNNTAISGASGTIITLLMATMLAWGLIKAMFGNGFNQFIEEVIHIFMISNFYIIPIC